jgi:2-dehydropantoate 2-reductase
MSSNSSQSLRLRIAIVGTGKIGSTFAFQLARAGHDVSIVARPKSTRLQQLIRAKGIVNVKGEVGNVQVMDALDETIPYDLVIVTVLAFQVDAVLPALRRSAARCIHFTFVTFEPERLQDIIGAHRCAFGMPGVQARLDEDGMLNATVGGPQKTLLSQQRWVDVFSAAGIPAALEIDMPLWLLCHAPLCVAFESVAVAGEQRGGGASWREASTIAQGLREGFALIQGLGFQIYPKSKVRLSGLPLWIVAAMLWLFSRIKSMRELLANGKNECRALVDVMVAQALRADMPDRFPSIEAMKPL